MVIFKTHAVENYGDWRPNILAIVAADGGDVLRKDVLTEAMNIHKTIVSSTVKYNHKSFTFENLCLKPLPVLGCAVG